MANPFYSVSGSPGTGTPGASATMRSEFLLVQAGFDKLPALTPAGAVVIVNSGATALTNVATASDATKFLNGAATPAFATVKDSDLAFTDVTTNNVTSSAHGFAPKAPASATQFLNGANPPAYAAVKDSDLAFTDITTNNVSTSLHGFVPKAPNDATKFLNGANPPAWTVPVSTTTGTATPTIAFGGASVGITYTTQTFEYTKVGDRVFYYFKIVLSGKGSSTGAATIVVTHPATPASSEEILCRLGSTKTTIAGSASTFNNMYAVVTATGFDLRLCGNNLATVAADDTSFNATSAITGVGHFRV